MGILCPRDPFIPEDNENLEHYEKNGLKENKSKTNEKSIKIKILKIYIFGEGNKKEYIIQNLFKNEIVEPTLQNLADREFKTDQFHWIARIFNDEKITEEKCKEIRKEIQKDKSSKLKNLLKYQVILCFGNENTKILSKNFINLRKNRMIFITNSKCEIDENIDKRYVTNIISRNMSNEQLNSKLISVLWELDCCFNEKGNQFCRYTPEKIFNGLEKDYSLFSINILLTGLSRTGKSTFINLLSGKIIALEADESVSVTKNISEYYIYKDDDKDEHGAIKIIDTPGIVPNKKEDNDEYQEVENKVINMIKEQDKSFENQIHFIFFVLNKGVALEGDNILKVLKSLNESKWPVFFLINKVKENISKPGKIINPLFEYLRREKLNKLSNKDFFLTVNFKDDEDDVGKIHGIDKILKK